MHELESVINPNCCELTSFIVMDILERAVELEKQGRDIIHLQIGEPDFDTPECVKEAACRAIMDGRTHYTHSLGLPELREAVCEHYNSRYGVSVTPNRVVVTSGTSPALMLGFSMLLGQGDEVLMSDPHYACYPNFVRFAGGVPVCVPVEEREGFQFRPERLRQAVTERTRGIIVNTPANPTGTMPTREQLEGVCNLGVPVFSDEIYHQLVYEGEEHTALEFTDDCFVFNGFSKAYAMTGWRLGYVIVPERFVPVIQKMQQNFFICAGSVAQWAGLAALREADEDVARMREVYDIRRKVLIAGLKKLGFGIEVEPTGAFYVLANAQKFTDDSLAFAMDILEKANVGVTPGIDFGKNAEGYIRFSYANSVENIERALERVGKSLESVKG
jgi:aspartate/methionine/tyrosine aminotransferase